MGHIIMETLLPAGGIVAVVGLIIWGIWAMITRNGN
jgi:hypothetical protein